MTDDLATGTADEPISDWLRVVRAEYLEMPGLNLTKPQVKRLWGFDTDTCDRVLEELEASHFLARTAHDHYILARH